MVDRFGAAAAVRRPPGRAHIVVDGSHMLDPPPTALLTRRRGNDPLPTGRVKCVLVGDGAVGKTSLVVSYTTNGYPTEYVPTAFDNYSVMVTVDNRPIRLQLCDTAGQDDFDSLRPLCYPGANVFLLCFSVVSPTSFYNVRDKWLPEIRQHCPDVPLVLVGTQCDLRTDVKVLIELAGYQEQPVSASAAARLAALIGAVDYVESSALTQKNLKEVFDTAILVSLQGWGSAATATPACQAATGGHEVLTARSVPEVGLWKKRSGRGDRAPPPAKRKRSWKRLFCIS